MHKRRSSHGFTLIEVMIVVVIIGILAAIAYPSYQDSIRKSRRADAQTALLELAQFMERQYTANGTYLTAANAAVTLPFTESPKDGATKHYNLAFSGNPTRNAYVLGATPKNAMANDPCGTLTLSNTGAKGQATGMSVTDCWRK